MALAKMVHRVPAKYRDLQERLTQEWRNPQEGTTEPIIIEEVGPQEFVPAHLYVIWSEWASLEQTERSELITDSCEEVRGRDLALNVTVAMGLTPEEAQRMGIEYAPLDTAA